MESKVCNAKGNKENVRRGLIGAIYSKTHFQKNMVPNKD